MGTNTQGRGLAGPTLGQRRLLRSMQQGNPIWELADQPYCTLYNEKTGRDHRIRLQGVREMEAFGWIRRVPNSSPNRLDSWEITDKGRAALGLEGLRSSAPG